MDGCWRSSTGVSPRPMLMGAPRNALRAFNAGVSLSCLHVIARKLPRLLSGVVLIARFHWKVMAHLPSGSIQTDRIHLLYTATHGRAFFFKIPQAECCPCGARKGRETCPVRRLNQHYFEACYNAADQFGLKPKPHIFIEIGRASCRERV